MDLRRHCRIAPLFLLLLGLVIASCDQGTIPPKKPSSAQARQNIESALDGLAESMRTLEEGAFAAAVKNVLGLEEGTASSADWATQLGTELPSVIAVGENGRFHFDESTGIYAWDAANQTWVQTDSADVIVLRFPASESATSATLRITSYSDVEHSVEGETVYLPESGAASLTVDSTEVFSVVLADAAYAPGSNSGFPFPTSFSVNVLTAPHRHAFRLKQAGPGRYAFSAETRNDGTPVAGLSATAQARLSRDGPTVDTLSGTVRIGPRLTLPYAIDVDELRDLNSPSGDEINALIDARVEYEGQSSATLRYDDEDEVIVVYPDGTADPASSFYEPFLTDLRSIWSSFLGSEPAKAAQEFLPSVGSSE